MTLHTALGLQINLHRGARRRVTVIAASIWLLLEALAFLVHIPPLANLLLILQETAFFLAILIVGTPFALLSESGLFKAGNPDRERVRRFSLFLLLLAAAGALWSFFHRGDEFLAASLPAIAFFVLQIALAGRLKPGS